MAQGSKKRKCRNCQAFFTPDYRNVKRQEYCSKTECRKAGKAACQRRWLQKKENQNYFNDSNNVRRVQEWRKKHPGYWRRKGPEVDNALQDSLPGESTKKQTVSKQLPPSALQDVLYGQHAVLIGLIAQFTGNTLQDDIANTTRHLQELGNDILKNKEGGNYDIKKFLMSSADPSDG